MKGYALTYEKSEKGCLLKSQDIGTQLFFPLAGSYDDLYYNGAYSAYELDNCAFYWSATFAGDGSHYPSYWNACIEYPWSVKNIFINRSESARKMSVRAARY